MKTVTQHQEEIKALMKKLGDMDAVCVSENRDPSEDEIALKNDIIDEIGKKKELIAIAQRQEAVAALIEGPTGVAKTVQNTAIVNATVKDRSKDRFKSLGEQLVSTMAAGIPGGSVDPRLRTIRAAAGSGLSESVPSDGGFLVQQDFSSELLEQVYETGLLAAKCRRIPISANSNSIKINGIDETSRASTRSGGILGYWEDEADEKTKSKPKFRKIELNLKKLIGLCYATDELLDDSAALEGVIRSGFASEFGFLTDEAIVNGSGAGQPLGMLQGGSLVTVGAETGQPADTIMTENIVNMYARRFASQTANYVWLYNQTIEPQLFTMSLAVGTGGIPVYMPPGGLNDAPYGRLMGLPAMAIEQASAIGDLGDIILANLPDGYILAEKGGIKADMSIHVRFIYDESVFRFVLRIDGQPIRASALTPYKGGATATQSHFITLEAR